MAHSLIAFASFSIVFAIGAVQDESPKADKSLAEAPVERPEAVEGGDRIGGLYRSGPIYLAAQPDPETFKRLAEDGVTVVINLRPDSEMESVPFDEPALVESLGLDYVSIPIGGAHPPRLRAVEQLRETLASHEGKALIHCSHAIRASRIWAAHLVKDRGISRSQADEYTNATFGGPANVDAFLGEAPDRP